MLQLEEDGDECRMPVVGVDDVRLKAQRGNAVEHSTAEEGEPLRIVGVAVIALAVKVLLIVHEVVGHAFILVGVDADKFLTPCDIECAVIDMLHLAADLRVDRPVLWQDDAAVHTRLDEGGRERSCHICESAGLYKGYCFRCCI